MLPFLPYKKTAELGVYRHDYRHSISAGNGVSYASNGGMEVAMPLLAVTSQPAYCSGAFSPKDRCRMRQDPRIRSIYTIRCKK